MWHDQPISQRNKATKRAVALLLGGSVEKTGKRG